MSGLDKDKLPSRGNEDVPAEPKDIEARSHGEKLPIQSARGPPPQSTEGTVSHWLLVAGGFLFVCNTLGLGLTFGVYEAYYVKHQLKGHSSSQVAWIATVQSFLMVFCGVFSGILFDHGYVRPLLVGGSVLVSLGMFMTSISGRYYSIFLSQGVCVGLGMSCLYTTALAMLSVTFTRRRQLALSIATSGTGVGGIVYPIIFTQLQPRVGFGWAVRVQAFVVLGTSALACFGMLVRGSPTRPPRSLIDRTAFRNRAFMAYCLSTFFMCTAYWIPFTFIPTFGVSSAGASTSFSFYLLAIANGSSIVGRVAPAFVIKWIAPSRFYFGSMIVSAILIFCWIPIDAVAGFTAWCVLWGIFSGPLGTLPASVVAELTSDMSVMGTRLGMLWAGGSFGVLIGSPIAGALFKHKKFGFVGGQSFAGAVMATAAILMLATIWLQRRGASDPDKTESSSREEA